MKLGVKLVLRLLVPFILIACLRRKIRFRKRLSGRLLLPRGSLGWVKVFQRSRRRGLMMRIKVRLLLMGRTLVILILLIRVGVPVRRARTRPRLMVLRLKILFMVFLLLFGRRQLKLLSQLRFMSPLKFHFRVMTFRLVNGVKSLLEVNVSVLLLLGLLLKTYLPRRRTRLF